MESLTGWMLENQTAVWLIAGVLLVAAEMVLPGIYLLWLGIASLATGAVMGLIPDMSVFYQFLTFAAFGTISIYGGVQHFYRRGDEDVQTEAEVNRRGGQFIGRTFTLIKAIENGRGKVKVGDGQWLVEGPDLPKGSTVKVTGVDGSLFHVVALEDKPSAAPVVDPAEATQEA